MEDGTPYSTQIDTGGGSHVIDGVNTGGGNFLGRDHVEIKEPITVNVYNKYLENSKFIWLFTSISAMLLILEFLSNHGLSSKITDLPNQKVSISTPLPTGNLPVSTPGAALVFQQVLVSKSREAFGLKVVLKNRSSYDILIKHIRFSTVVGITNLRDTKLWLTQCNFIQSSRISATKYIIADKITVSDTSSIASISGNIREGNSQFYYPLLGSLMARCNDRGSRMQMVLEFRTSFLLPAGTNSSFSIQIPSILKAECQRRLGDLDESKIPPPLFLHINSRISEEIFISILTDSQAQPINVTSALP